MLGLYSKRASKQERSLISRDMETDESYSEILMTFARRYPVYIRFAFLIANARGDRFANR